MSFARRNITQYLPLLSKGKLALTPSKSPKYYIVPPSRFNIIAQSLRGGGDQNDLVNVLNAVGISLQDSQQSTRCQLFQAPCFTI